MRYTIEQLGRRIRPAQPHCYSTSYPSRLSCSFRPPPETSNGVGGALFVTDHVAPSHLQATLTTARPALSISHQTFPLKGATSVNYHAIQIVVTRSYTLSILADNRDDAISDVNRMLATHDPQEIGPSDWTDVEIIDDRDD